MILSMEFFRKVFDRLLMAPAETPGAALVQGSDSTGTERLSVDSAGRPVLVGRDGRVRPLVLSPTVYLLLDVSGSMDEPKLRQARDGGIAFAEDAVRKSYMVGVIQFSSEAWLRVVPTRDRRAIERGLSEIGPQESTNMAAAIRLATKRFGPSRGDRAMVLVTDGYPDDVAATSASAEEAKRRGITIIAIGTDDADGLFLRKLASASALAATVPSGELRVAIASAARLLPAKRCGSR